MTMQDSALTETEFKGFADEGLGSEGAAGEWERAFAEAGLAERSEGLHKDAEAGIGGLPEDDGEQLPGMGISIGEAEIREMLEKAGVLRDGKVVMPGARAEAEAEKRKGA